MAMAVHADSGLPQKHTSASPRSCRARMAWTATPATPATNPLLPQHGVAALAFVIREPGEYCRESDVRRLFHPGNAPSSARSLDFVKRGSAAPPAAADARVCYSASHRTVHAQSTLCRIAVALFCTHVKTSTDTGHGAVRRHMRLPLSVGFVLLRGRPPSTPPPPWSRPPRQLSDRLSSATSGRLLSVGDHVCISAHAQLGRQ
jgi:hypothetical protein